MNTCRHIRFFVIFIISSCLFFPATAQVYRWVDERGVVQFGDRPLAGNKAQIVEAPMGGPSRPTIYENKELLESIQNQETEFQKRRILREDTERKESLVYCGALARNAVEGNKTAEEGRDLIGRITMRCPNVNFDCITYKNRPHENKCFPVQKKGNVTIVRNKPVLD